MSNCAITEEYDQALQMARKENPDIGKAGGLLEVAHALGDRRASYALATWYMFGNDGYKKNIAKAISLLKLAAKSDIAYANHDLAVAYETGTGVKKNKKIAYNNYVAAVLNGDYDAAEEVGRCLYYGIGVNRDRKMAKIWYAYYEKRKKEDTAENNHTLSFRVKESRAPCDNQKNKGYG